MSICIPDHHSAETKRTLIDSDIAGSESELSVYSDSDITGATFYLSLPVELSIRRTIESLDRHP